MSGQGSKAPEVHGSYLAKLTRILGWKILFVTSWGRFQRKFDHILEDLDRHGSLVDNEANAHNIAESRRMREEVQAWKEKSIIKMEQDDKDR